MLVFQKPWRLGDITVFRADSRLAPSQRETSLQSNAVSHWLGANLELALCITSELLTQRASIVEISLMGYPVTEVVAVWGRLRPGILLWWPVGLLFLHQGQFLRTEVNNYLVAGTGPANTGHVQTLVLVIVRGWLLSAHGAPYLYRQVMK